MGSCQKVSEGGRKWPEEKELAQWSTGHIVLAGEEFGPQNPPQTAHGSQ